MMGRFTIIGWYICNSCHLKDCEEFQHYSRDGWYGLERERILNLLTRRMYILYTYNDNV